MNRTRCGLYGLSFYSKHVKDSLADYLVVVYLVIIFHVIYVIYQEQFPFSVAVSIPLFVLTINLTLRDVRWLMRFNVFVILVNLIAIWLAPWSIMEIFMYMMFLVATMVLSYFTSYSRMDVNQKLRESEAKYRNVVERANDLILLIQDYRIEYANSTAIRVLGYSAKELIGSDCTQYLLPETLRAFRSVYEKSLHAENESAIYETIMLTKAGEQVHTEFNCGGISYQGEGALLVIIRDITERKHADAQIRELSFHDKLTGLYNRAYFEEEIVRLDTPRQLPISLIMGDVNGLKLANDTFGHSVGDEQLVGIANLLRFACRKEDIISRWGGDEFLVLLPQTPIEVAEGICQRIREACKQSDDRLIQLSISLGVATKTDEDTPIAAVLSTAEERMYECKLSESKEARHNMLLSLENLLAVKSTETKEHTRRMEGMGQSFGQALGLSSYMIDQLSQLALVHDIGKIATPEQILNKVGALTDDEWAVMRKHPETGYRIATTSPELSHIAVGILHHHEWWNGNGYPEGLAGEEIPLICRIITIIDAYDVMRYIKGTSRSAVIAELKQCAGTQFDPALVQVFTEQVLPKHE